MKWLRKLFFFISLCKSDGILQVDTSLLVGFFLALVSDLSILTYDQRKTFCKPKSIFFLFPKMARGTYDIIYCYLKLTFWKCVGVVILYLSNIEKENIY